MKETMILWFESKYWQIADETKEMLLKLDEVQLSKKIAEWCAWHELKKLDWS